MVIFHTEINNHWINRQKGPAHIYRKKNSHLVNIQEIIEIEEKNY